MLFDFNNLNVSNDSFTLIDILIESKEFQNDSKVIMSQNEDKKKFIRVKNSKLFLSNQQYNMTNFQDITYKY